MANQLDEMNPEIIEEGRDIHVIAKVLPVEVSVQEKMIPAIIMIIGIMIIFIALLSERYGGCWSFGSNISVVEATSD